VISAEKLRDVYYVGRILPRRGVTPVSRLRNKQLTSEPFCHKRYGGVKKRQHGADSRPTKMLFWRNVIVDNN
jgi:hypothetical protein